MNENGECPFCQNEDEGINHLLKSSNFSSTVCSTITLNYSDPNNNNLQITDCLEHIWTKLV